MKTPRNDTICFQICQMKIINWNESVDTIYKLTWNFVFLCVLSVWCTGVYSLGILALFLVGIEKVPWEFSWDIIYLIFLWISLEVSFFKIFNFYFHHYFSFVIAIITNLPWDCDFPAKGFADTFILFSVENLLFEEREFLLKVLCVVDNIKLDDEKN